MERFRFSPFILALAAIVLVCAPSNSQSAQPSQDRSTPLPHVRKADRRPMPFPPGSEAPSPAAALEFRPFDQMTQQDRESAADAEFAIGEQAGFAGLEFNQGKWNYQQVVCSALPNHLFLQFTRNNGTGDVSVFSAAIPREGRGRVRVIPILRRSYSLFFPAPINAQTISAFNHIRIEEHSDQPLEWLATGLCYAALAGAHPQIGPADESNVKKLPAVPTGSLMIPLHGGAVISFTDVTTIPHPMKWTMTFDSNGKLLKATHSAAPKARDKVAVRTPVEVQGKPVQQRH
jgi:hypothetical protein